MLRTDTRPVGPLSQAISLRLPELELGAAIVTQRYDICRPAVDDFLLLHNHVAKAD